MKQLITILLCLFTLFAEAQVNTNDTNKYFKSYDYGFSYKRLQAREAFIMPTDTVINKLGAVSLNGAIYLGNGIKWTSIGGGSSIDTTSLSNRINQRIDSLRRRNDSIFARKNGVFVFQYKDSIGTTPTLQQVTDAGATTTNIISVPALRISNGGDSIALTRSGDGSFVITRSNTSDELLNVNDGVNGYLRFGGGAGQYVQITTTGGNVELTAPTTSGTIALTSDTTNKFVNRIERTPGKDSIIYFVGANRFAIKDSVGGGAGSDTAKVVIAQVHNATGTTLLRGEVVYLFGSTGNVASVKRANNKDDSTSSKTFGIVRDNILTGANGFITTQGQVEKLTLGAYNEGDVLWVDSIDGQFTKVKPQAPYHAVFVGIVERANNGNGLAYIKPQNGVELDEVHDVQINNLINNQIIVYSDTQKVWKNRSIYSLVDTINRIATKSNLALKLNISDTATMLSNYARTNVVNASLATKLNISDTSSMLTNYARTNLVNTKLNISDTSVFDRKSISAYSFNANNTNVTANVTSQSFRDTSGTYNGTITWTGTTAPSGATNHSYRLTQVGKCVTLHIALVFATNGAGLTAVQMTLPSGAPTPVQPTGLTAASTNMYPVNGQIVNSANTILSSSSRGFLRNNSAGNGFEILINFATAALAQVGVTLQYWTN